MPKVKLTEWQIQNLAIPLVERFAEIEEFYKNPENEQRFRKWYEAFFGKPVPQGV